VLGVALAFFGLAALAGLTLVVLTQQWWLLRSRPRPSRRLALHRRQEAVRRYYSLGGLFVFVFFGLVATLGTTYVQALTVNTGAG
jgi:1,4-dihydroxy-2-naphthoate octaprenyltransferase